jgi:hypothetical protein
MTKHKEKFGLLVSHNIFLTRDQRYTLIKGNPITVIGVSLPVWFTVKGGKTSEPANEVFCNYRIANKEGPLATAYENGYDINLPQLPDDYEVPSKPTNEEWRKMSFEDREKWYADNKLLMTIDNLRDIDDNGGEYLRIEEQKTLVLPNGTTPIVHVVEIKKFDVLEETSLH